MTKTRHLITSAPLAIAAMAALHTVPAVAQEAPQIVLDIPAPAPTAAPSPVVIQPAPQPTAAAPATTATATPVVAPKPVVTSTTTRTAAPVEAEPVAAPAKPAAKAATTTRAAASEPAPRPAARSIPAAAPVEAAPVEAAPELTAGEAFPAAPVASEADLAVPVAAPEATPLDQNQLGSSAALLLALLGVGGIGLLAFFLMRRRRRHDEVPVIERPMVEPMAVAAPPVIEREPVVTTYDKAPVTITPVKPVRPAAPSNGAAVELPRELPESYEERDRLLRKMVDAEPDRANPFRSGKARAKRARLILQSIGESFHERKPRIDLSQYTHIWPELRGWSPRTPAMA